MLKKPQGDNHVNETNKQKSTGMVLYTLLNYLTVFLIFALLSTLASRLFYPAGFRFDVDESAFIYEYTDLGTLLADSLHASLGELAVLLVILFTPLTLIPKQISAAIFALKGFSCASVICKFINDSTIKENAPIVFAMLAASVLTACYAAFATFFSIDPKRRSVLSAFLRAAVFYPIFAGAICAVSAIKLYLLS